jgi:soluble lytic murein transglycosylase-like protein
MRTFPLFWRWRAVNLATRHVIVLSVLGIVLAGGAVGGSLLGVFAHAPCASGDRAYTVVSGDTLSGIALRYRTTWWRLSAYNHLVNANLIYVAQVICIPGQVHGSGGGSGTLPRSRYVALARQDAIDVNIPPDLFIRQINLESGFNPNAISPAGAIGIAQFMPGTAADLGINPYDPVSSLRGAAGLMSHYVEWYGGNYAKALAAYNAGPGTVNWAVWEGGWNWQAYLPYETRAYIRIVMV